MEVFLSPTQDHGYSADGVQNEAVSGLKAMVSGVVLYLGLRLECQAYHHLLPDTHISCYSLLLTTWTRNLLPFLIHSLELSLVFAAVQL